MKVHISGPITNNPHYISDFLRAEYWLKKIGNEPLSPVGDEKPEYTWKDYMRRDIKLLIEADAIYMLKGWRRSKGARLERKIAKGLDLKIIYQK